MCNPCHFGVYLVYMFTSRSYADCRNCLIRKRKRKRKRNIVQVSDVANLSIVRDVVGAVVARGKGRTLRGPVRGRISTIFGRGDHTPATYLGLLEGLLEGLLDGRERAGVAAGVARGALRGVSMFKCAHDGIAGGYSLGGLVGGPVPGALLDGSRGHGRLGLASVHDRPANGERCDHQRTKQQ